MKSVLISFSFNLNDAIGYALFDFSFFFSCLLSFLTETGNSTRYCTETQIPKNRFNVNKVNMSINGGHENRLVSCAAALGSFTIHHMSFRLDVLQIFIFCTTNVVTCDVMKLHFPNENVCLIYWFVETSGILYMYIRFVLMFKFAFITVRYKIYLQKKKKKLTTFYIHVFCVYWDLLHDLNNPFKTLK